MKLVLPLALALWLAQAGPVVALPVFAHRYGLSCQACHTIVPELNEFGERFKKDGFRLPHGQPTFPIAVKVKLAFSSESENGLPKAVVDEIELLTGGSAGKNLSYFIEQYVVDGGEAGLTRDAWLQFDSSQFHLRAGEFSLPLPVDVETERKTESHYMVYDQSVGLNEFTFFAPRIGTDAFFGDANGTFEAHFSLAEAYDRQSGVPISGLDRMITVRKTSGKFNGWLYRYDGQRRFDPVADRFTRTGYALSVEPSPQFAVTGALQSGFDSSADGYGTGARSSGGFIEGTLHVDPRTWLVGRYEATYDDVGGMQRRGVFSLVLRPAKNMRLTIEDQVSDHHSLNMAFLFAY